MPDPSKENIRSANQIIRETITLIKHKETAAAKEHLIHWWPIITFELQREFLDGTFLSSIKPRYLRKQLQDFPTRYRVPINEALITYYKSEEKKRRSCFYRDVIKSNPEWQANDEIYRKWRLDSYWFRTNIKGKEIKKTYGEILEKIQHHNRKRNCIIALAIVIAVILCFFYTVNISSSKRNPLNLSLFVGGGSDQNT